MTFVIYHVSGVKVGCTKSFTKRIYQNRKTYGFGISTEVLEIIPSEFGEKFAGDQEQYWNWYFGYTKNCHYTHNWNNRKLDRKQIAADAVKKQFELGIHVSQRGIGVQNFTREQRAIAGSSSIKLQIKNGTHINFRRVICPHCGKTGQMTIMNRWHFDKCKIVRA